MDDTVEPKIDTKKSLYIINWLLIRWSMLLYSSAVEELQKKNIQEPSEGMPFVGMNFGSSKTSMQISIIKSKIVEIFPNAIFILPDFQDYTNLSTEDFVDVFLEYHRLSIGKVRELMQKLGTE